MTLIKYYNLESQSLKDVSELTKNLQKYLLNEKFLKNVENYDSNKEDIKMLLNDSGDFDVLYRESKVKKKKGIFRKPSLVETKLVVKATLEEILKLQDCLSNSGFEVVEARSVKEANLNFSGSPNNLYSYPDIIKSSIKNKYPNILFDYIYGSGKTIMGILFGPVLDILKIRKIIFSKCCKIDKVQEDLSFE